MSGDGLAWYAYAVLPAGGAAPAVPPILPGATIEAVALAGLTVLASRVARSLFDRDDPANRTGEPDWIAARIAAHYGVAAAAPSCLPLAFGALFSSLERLDAWLAPRRGAMLAALAEVDGRAEWTLAVDAAPAHAAWLDRHDPELAALAARVRGAGAGTAFLMARRLEQAREAARRTHLAGVAAEAAAGLRAAGLRVLEEPWRDGLPALAVLAPEAGGALPGVVAALADRLDPQGLGVRLAGPWPAYGFAREAVHV